MKRQGTSVPIVQGIAGLIAAIFAIFSAGCLDRQPAPVCPVPIEVASNKVNVGEFDGVDIIAVVDNSGSMGQEQQILATGFFTLINSLADPTSDWPYPAVPNIRLAVVSSNMGLQYGEERSTEFSTGPDGIDSKTCKSDAMRGDDGRFLTISVPGNVTTVLSGQIPCETGGTQCPDTYICDQGRCRSQDGTDLIVCPTLAGTFAETTSDSKNVSFTAQTACLATQGTLGCGFEQQLEAGVRSIERTENQSFISPGHLLAVLIVSDEEDCSIEKPDLFKTSEWNDRNLMNAACNIDDAHEANLFSTDRYKKAFVDMKQGMESSVIFAAIVGVPNEDFICQGTGTQLAANGCLAHAKMQMSLGTFTDPDSKTPYTHFFPACTRVENNIPLTEARPGRRFVKVAESFGENGYVSSICNADWSGAMNKIAGIIARQIEPSCFSKKLEWQPMNNAETTMYPGCANCGFALCDAVMERFVALGDSLPELCPAALYENLPDSEKERYQKMITQTNVQQGGQVIGQTVTCPIPQLPSAVDCKTAQSETAARYPNMAGWFYCQASGLNTASDSCSDGFDNDGNSVADCGDPDCSSCSSCGGVETECREGCAYSVSFNEKAQQYLKLGTVKVQCMQQTTLEDQNCLEDSPGLCDDGEDNDGNGLIDCDDTLLSGTPDAHAPDPNCCPMTAVGGKCVPVTERIRENCESSASVQGVAADFWQVSANLAQIPACADQAERLNCTW